MTATKEPGRWKKEAHAAEAVLGTVRGLKGARDWGCVWRPMLMSGASPVVGEATEPWGRLGPNGVASPWVEAGVAERSHDSSRMRSDVRGGRGRLSDVGRRTDWREGVGTLRTASGARWET